MLRPTALILAMVAAAPLLAQAAGTPGPRPLPRAEFAATMDSEFKKIDSDKDGHLTRAEIEQFQRTSGQAQVAARRSAIFALLDKDGNGQISVAEFTKLPINPPRVDASGLLKFDTSHDGKVSLLEHRTATLSNFDRLDTDKDGIVSPAEMKAGGLVR